MKKLFIFALTLSLGLIFYPKINAYDLEVIDGSDWEIQDYLSFNWTLEYDLTNDILYIENDAFESSYSNNWLRLTGESVFDALELDINTPILDTWYDEPISFQLYTEDTDKFNYLIIETSNNPTVSIDTTYYRLDWDTQFLDVDIDFYYKINEEETYPNVFVRFFDDSYTQGITIDGTLFPINATLQSFELVRFSLIYIPTETEQGFIVDENWDFWYGYDESTLKDGFLFTENYFLKYVNDNILPYTNNNPTYETALINEYVTKIQTEGITVNLPPTFEVALFVPAFYLDSIDYWYVLSGNYSTVNIKVPDLTYDGTELWGDTLIYTVDGTPYEFSLTDDFENTIVPIFGIRVSTTFHTVTFNTTGGSPINSQFVAHGGTPTTPDRPTKSGYTFFGWTTVTDINYNQPFGSRLEGVYSLSSFTITENKTFYAIWIETGFTIYLIPNGAIRKVHPDFTDNRLFVLYGQTANNNVYDVPFNDMFVKPGSSLFGWYIDAEFTTQFNPNTPIYDHLTIYAKWENTSLGENSPSRLNQLLANFNLFNNEGMMIVYFVVLFILFIVLAVTRVPGIITVIGFTAINALWLFLGWLTPFAVLLLMMINILVFVLILKGRGE